MHVRRSAILAAASLALFACSPARDLAHAPAGAPARSAPLRSAATAAIPDIDQTIANLVAFTKLLGYVRYFHPSDEAANADWEALAVGAVPRVEHARDAAELAAALDAVFRPVAPTLRVYPSGHAPSPPSELRPPPRDKDPTYVGWVHHGLPSETPYWSVRASNKATPHGRPGELMASVTLPPGKHARLRVKAWVRTEGTSQDGGAVLTTTVQWDGADKTGPIAAPEWVEVERVSAIGPDDTDAAVAVRLVGDGNVWVDDVRAWVEDDGGKATAVIVDNGAFERGRPGDGVPGWYDLGNEGAGYRIRLASARSHEGAQCAEITALPLPLEPLAAPAETFHTSLPGGVEADIPLSLYVDAAGHTLPTTAMRSNAQIEPLIERVGRYSADDRAVRIADVALAWNAAEHFYPYFEVVKSDWAGALRVALTGAIADADARQFHTTLRRMWAELHDGHGFVRRWRVGADGKRQRLDYAFLPLTWRVVEGKLVVTAVHDGAGDVRVGDVVVAIEGRAAADVLAEAAHLVSAATPQWAREAAAVELLWRDRGDEVHVTLARGQSGESHDVTVRPTVPRRSYLPDERTGDVIREVQRGVVYVDLDRVTDGQIESAMPMLVAARGIVLDMRGYPNDVSAQRSFSHFFTSPIHASKSWIPTLVRPDRQALAWTEWGGPPYEVRLPHIPGKLAMLIDERAISNAEAWLENAIDQKGVALVGTPTAGTDGNVIDIMLPGAFVVRMTGLKVTHFDGSQLHGIGILPTVPCAPTIAGIAAGKDEVLDCGIRAVTP